MVCVCAVFGFQSSSTLLVGSTSWVRHEQRRKRRCRYHTQLKHDDGDGDVAALGGDGNYCVDAAVGLRLRAAGRLRCKRISNAMLMLWMYVRSFVVLHFSQSDCE